jgi:hypothetical protein
LMWRSEICAMSMGVMSGPRPGQQAKADEGG